MKDETNCGPLSEMTFLGVPWSLNMESRNIVATPFEVIESMTGKRCIILENQSTTTRIAFLPSDWGRGPIRSMEMISQGEDGISFGCRGVVLEVVLAFTF